MPLLKVHICQCPRCRQEADHPDKKLHQQMNLFLSRLDEQQRRWYVGLESKRIGRGGDRLLSQITGLDEKTIQRGRRELDAALAGVLRIGCVCLAAVVYRLKKRPGDRSRSGGDDCS